MVTASASEMLQTMESGGCAEGAEQLRPIIIANQNIDLNKVTNWWSGHLNDAWAEAIDAKIAEGFVTVRIQTEFMGIHNGHTTKIYMAKMKQ